MVTVGGRGSREREPVMMQQHWAGRWGLPDACFLPPHVSQSGSCGKGRRDVASQGLKSGRGMQNGWRGVLRSTQTELLFANILNHDGI